MKLLSKLLWMLLALLFLSALNPAEAQPPAAPPDQPAVDRKPPSSRDGLRGLRPTREERASWSVPGMDRKIRIHPSDPTDGGNVYWYMHRPILALIENDSPPDGCPKIVKHREFHEDGSATLTFRVLVSSPEFREFCRSVVIQQDKENIAKSGGREDLVKIFPWPLERMVIDCKVGNTPRVLATGETDNLGSIDDAFDFDLDFSAAALSEFLARATQDGVRFAFSYTFSNREVAVAEADYQVIGMVQNSLNRVLTSDQRTKQTVVFQQQVNELKRDLRLSIVSTVRSTSKDVLPRVNPDNIVAKIMEMTAPVDLINADEKDPVAIEAAKYAAPLLEKYSSTNQATDTTTDEHEKKRKETIELSASGPIKKFTGEGKFTLEKEKRDLLRNEHGITITDNTTKERFAPILVTTYRASADLSKITFSFAEVQFIGMGSSSDYLPDTPIPPSFTASAVLKHLGQQQTELFYDGVPLGTMLSYFGNTPPKGWVWADGKSQWPDEAWVPAHLRGKPVPNMAERMAYGSGKSEIIGTLTDGTTATKDLPNITLPQTSEIGNGGQASFLTQKVVPAQRAHAGGSYPWKGGLLIQVVPDPKDGSYNVPPGINLGNNAPTPGSVDLRQINLPGPWKFAEKDRTIKPGSISFSGAEVIPARVNSGFIIRLGRMAIPAQK